MLMKTLEIPRWKISPFICTATTTQPDLFENVAILPENMRGSKSRQTISMALY